jgi:hypothetical protein
MGTIRSTLELIFPPLIRGPPSNTTLNPQALDISWSMVGQASEHSSLAKKNWKSNLRSLILFICVDRNIPPSGLP